MARCEVVQVQCDRCKRVDLRTPTPPKAKPDFELFFLGRHVKFDDLCERCKPAISRLITHIEEWDRELTQKLGPTVSSNEAPPTEVAPNYNPAQPHLAGRK